MRVSESASRPQCQIAGVGVDRAEITEMLEYPEGRGGGAWSSCFSWFGVSGDRDDRGLVRARALPRIGMGWVRVTATVTPVGVALAATVMSDAQDGCPVAAAVALVSARAGSSARVPFRQAGLVESCGSGDGGRIGDGGRLRAGGEPGPEVKREESDGEEKHAHCRAPRW